MAGAEFLTSRDVADILQVTRRTVERWRQRGGGPPYTRIGKRTIRYARVGVLAFAELYTVRARAQLPAADPRQLPLLLPTEAQPS